MKRRTWLLFGLFVAIALFYARVGGKTVDLAVSGQANQLKALQKAEERSLGVAEMDDDQPEDKATADPDNS